MIKHSKMVLIPHFSAFKIPVVHGFCNSMPNIDISSPVDFSQVRKISEVKRKMKV